MIAKRLARDIEGLRGCERVASVECGRADEVQVLFAGPADTPWSGTALQVAMHLPPSYPFQPPTITCRPAPFHPNIDRSGNVCMDMLKLDRGWRPALTLADVLLAFACLLVEPNPDDPLNAEAGRLYLDDRAAYCARARDGVRSGAAGVRANLLSSSARRAHRDPATPRREP